MVIFSLSFSDFRVHSHGGSLRQRGAPSFQQRHDQHRHLRRQRQPAAFLPGKLQPHHSGERGKRGQCRWLIRGGEGENEVDGKGRKRGGGAGGIAVDTERGINREK